MSPQTQVVTLQLDADLFALPVAQVQEILDLQPLLKVPRWPAPLLGVVDVRGEGVAVIDLRNMLGLTPSADNTTTRLVVLRLDTPRGAVRIALKTERVIEVTDLDDNTLGTLPETGNAEWNTRFVAGLGRRNGQLVAVLDLAQMFDLAMIEHASNVRAA